jgi:hypothetical protein
MLTVFEVQLGWKFVDPLRPIAYGVLLRVVENPSFESLRDHVQEDASDYSIDEGLIFQPPESLHQYIFGGTNA